MDDRRSRSPPRRRGEERVSERRTGSSVSMSEGRGGERVSERRTGSSSSEGRGEGREREEYKGRNSRRGSESDNDESRDDEEMKESIAKRRKREERERILRQQEEYRRERERERAQHEKRSTSLRSRYRSVSRSPSPAGKWIVRESRGKEKEDVRSKQRNRKDLLEKWEKEDEERSKVREELLDREDVDEATTMRDKSIDEQVVFKSGSFSNDEAYILYLVYMVKLAMDNKDENLTDNLGEYVIGNPDYEVYLGKHNVDPSFIIFSSKLTGNRERTLDFLSNVEYIRTENKLSSILDEVFKQNIITPEDWILDIIRNDYTGPSDIVLLKKLIYEYGSPEIRRELEEMISNREIRDRDIRDIVEDYLGLEEEV